MDITSPPSSCPIVPIATANSTSFPLCLLLPRPLPHVYLTHKSLRKSCHLTGKIISRTDVNSARRIHQIYTNSPSRPKEQSWSDGSWKERRSFPTGGCPPLGIFAQREQPFGGIYILPWGPGIQHVCWLKSTRPWSIAHFKMADGLPSTWQGDFYMRHRRYSA